ncbi:MAG: CBS domain-containing protein [Actinomycetota bacterium]
MKAAREIMNASPITVGSDTSVREMAGIMVENRIRCLPVEEEGKLLGVVDEEDLVHRDARVHFPTFIHFLESYIFQPLLPEALREVAAPGDRLHRP